MQKPVRSRPPTSDARSALRILIAALLVVSFALENLPFRFVDAAPVAAGEPDGRSCCIEPQQFCDTGEGSESFLFELPALVPGNPGFLRPPGTLVPRADDGLPVPAGFRPAIDRPPQLSA